MSPPPYGGGIKRCFCLTSVVYIGRNSRTERPRKTKIGTEVAHVTCDSDTTFKVKGQLVADVLNSQHDGTGATWRINTKILSTCRGAEAYRGGRPPTACYCYSCLMNIFERYDSVIVLLGLCQLPAFICLFLCECVNIQCILTVIPVGS